MAESSNLFETLKCIICLDFAENAVETSCCHQVCCHDCGQPLEKCPTCEEMVFQLQPSIAIRRLIDNFPADCPYEKCGTKTTKGELKAHLETCPVKNQIPCLDKQCDFADKAEVVANHVVEQHPETTVEYLTKNLSNMKTVRKEKCFFPSCNVRSSNDEIRSHVRENHRDDLKVFHDVSSSCFVSTTEPVKLKNGLCHPVKMGKNGKFYCGMENSVREGQHCTHPNDNCCACMKLDLMFRDLAPYQLVNKEGKVCKTDPCNHCVGGYFSGQTKKREISSLCQKSTCGNDPIFYCERSREVSVHDRSQHCMYCFNDKIIKDRPSYGYNAYPPSCRGVGNYIPTTVYCRRHGENSEFCSACRDITKLMADPYMVYNAVWDS